MDMQKVLEQLIEESPIPVIRGCTLEFIKNNFEKFDPECQEGMKCLLDEAGGGASYVTLSDAESKKMGYPKEFFMLEQGTDDAAKHVYFMFHEIGHYVCNKNDCRCRIERDDYIASRVLEEYHAERYAFRELIRLDYKDALNTAIDHTIGYAYSAEKKCPYKLMSKRLMRTKLWTRAREYVAPQAV